MVITTLHLQNATLLIAGLINVAMTMMVFSRGIKNKVNLYFGLLTFFNFLWSISLLLSVILFFDTQAVLFYRTAYFSAIWISVFLFYFTLHFPYKIKSLGGYSSLGVYFLAIILSIFVYTKFHIVSFERSVNFSGWFVDYQHSFYMLYSLFLFVVFLLAVYFLIDKIGTVEGFLRNKIKVLLITIIIGLICGLYFNLILCYFQNWNYIWFGPIFTAFMNVYVFYLITSSKEKNKNG